MSIQKNRLLMEAQIKRLRGELNEGVSKFQRDLMIDSELKPGMKITSIKDVTPIPHNGCRPRKRRRV